MTSQRIIVLLTALVATASTAAEQPIASKWREWRYPVRVHLKYIPASKSLYFKDVYSSFYGGPAIEGGWPLGSFKRPFYAGYVEISSDHALQVSAPLSPAWKVLEAEARRVNRTGAVYVGKQRSLGIGIKADGTPVKVIMPEVRPACYRGPRRKLPETVLRHDPLFVAAFLKHMCITYNLTAVEIVQTASPTTPKRAVHKD